MKIDSQLFSEWRINSNKTYEWYQTDSYNSYTINLTKNKEKLQLNGWIDNSFTYNFNSHGFRCKEFTDTDSIMFLGCSVTQGVGLPLDYMFPEIICQKLNYHCVNLGLGGSSADTAFRLATIYLEKIRPKIVIATLLFPERTEILSSYGSLYFTPTLTGENTIRRKYFTDFYEKWIDRPEQSHLNMLKNVFAINKMCDNLNIKFINSQDYEVKQIQHKNKARDLQHPGKDYHEKIAEVLLSKL